MLELRSDYPTPPPPRFPAPLDRLSAAVQCRAMRLTDEHRETVDRDGLVLLDEVFTDDELNRASEGIDHLYTTGDRDNGIIQYYTEPGLMHILAHPNLEAIARHVLRADAVVLNSTASLYRKPDGVSEWTCDPYEHVDIQFSLEDLDATPRRMLAMMMVFVEDLPPGRGNTWVRLGSHRRIAEHLHAQGLDPAKTTATNATDLPDLGFAPLTPVVAKRGQVAAFSTALLHCGSTNIDTQPRKVLFVNFNALGYLKHIFGQYVLQDQRTDWRNFLATQFAPDRHHLLLDSDR